LDWGAAPNAAAIERVDTNKSFRNIKQFMAAVLPPLCRSCFILVFDETVSPIMSGHLPNRAALHWNPSLTWRA
jgi:hypothetical protein